MPLLRPRLQLEPSPSPPSPGDAIAAKTKRPLDPSPPALVKRHLLGRIHLQTPPDALLSPVGCGACVSGCTRVAGHLGLCVTSDGLAPPPIKVAHANAKKDRRPLALFNHWEQGPAIDDDEQDKDDDKD
jgi:hypothetical protein